jgi:hypothetical protein
MNAKHVLHSALTFSRTFLPRLLTDLSDSDLFVRPVPGANTIAWQLGHLIVTEQRALTGVFGGTPPPLPEHFATRHGKEGAGDDSSQGLATKAVYLDLYDRTRQATIDALEKLPEADLDKPTEGNIARMAPTVGDAFLLMAQHPLLHVGQYSIVRRKLGKPVVM